MSKLDDLKIKAQQIRTNELPESNTAELVGQTFKIVSDLLGGEAAEEINKAIDDAKEFVDNDLQEAKEEAKKEINEMAPDLRNDVAQLSSKVGVIGEVEIEYEKKNLRTLYPKKNIGYQVAGGKIGSTTENTWFYSDMIPVIEGAEYEYSGFTTHSVIMTIAFFDANEKYISGIMTSASGSGTIPAGTKYVRVSGGYNNAWTFMTDVEVTETIVKKIDKINYKIGEIDAELSNAEYSQLYGKNYGFQNSKGETQQTSDNDWFFSDMMPVIEGAYYTYSKISANDVVMTIGFFDEDKKLISGKMGSLSGSGTIPSGAKFVRLSGRYNYGYSFISLHKQGKTISERLEDTDNEIKEIDKSKADNYIYTSALTDGQASVRGHLYVGYGAIFKATYEEDRYLTAVDLVANYEGNAYIYVATPNEGKTNCVITDIVTIQLIGKHTDLENPILLPKGSVIGINGVSNALLAEGTYHGSCWYLDAGRKAVGSTISTNYTSYPDIQLTLKKKELLSDILGGISSEYTGEVNIKNSDCLICEGSSFTEGVCHPVGMSWTEKLNNVIDLPVVNDGKSGSARSYGIANIKDGGTINNCQSVKIGSINLKYVYYGNTANGSPLGESGYNELLSAKYYAELRGAEMLVGEEERAHAGNCEPLYYAFSQQNKVKMAENLNKVGTQLYPSGRYAGLLLGFHHGWRACACYAIHYNFFKSLPINKCVKLYRVRPNISVSAVSELFYKTSKDRQKKWYAIGSGQCGNTSAQVIVSSSDNLDKISGSSGTTSFDVPATSATYTRNSETAILMSGGNIPFSGYALAEFILDVTKATKAEFKFNCSAEPTNVYIYDKDALKEVEFEYEGKSLTFKVDTPKLTNSKISVLICGSEFNISSPSCKYAGVQKQTKEFVYNRRKYGTEILSATNVEGLSGVITLPSQLDLRSGYNNSWSVVKLAKNDATSKAFTTSGIGNYAFRIAAQNFFKIMTTRFDDSGSLPSALTDYVNNKQESLTNWQYDKGQVLVMVDNLYTYKLDVESGWTELYFEIENLASGSHTISIKNINDVNVDTPILIHDISVQKV